MKLSRQFKADIKAGKIGKQLSKVLTGSQTCMTVWPELFFADNPAHISQAKAICGYCPCRTECLAYSLNHKVQGVWGGTDEEERARFCKDLNIVPELLLFPKTM